MQPFGFSSQWLATSLSPDALIASLSSGTEALTGFSAQELIGKPITQILADPSAFEMPAILRTARELGFWEGNLVHRTRGGKLLETRCMISLLSGSENRHEGFLLVASLDQTSPAVYFGSPATAEISAKLRALVHDMNNPLAVAMGFAQLLVLNTTCPGQVRSDIEKVYVEIQRITQMVERLHEYAISLNEPSAKSQIADFVKQSA